MHQQCALSWKRRDPPTGQRWSSPGNNLSLPPEMASGPGVPALNRKYWLHPFDLRETFLAKLPLWRNWGSKTKWNSALVLEPTWSSRVMAHSNQEESWGLDHNKRSLLKSLACPGHFCRTRSTILPLDMINQGDTYCLPRVTGEAQRG